MLKTGLKNFFKNMLYVFVPMGIIYLFLIAITYGFIWNTASNLGVMIRDMFKLLGKTVESSGTSISEFIDYSWAQLDIEKGPVEIFRQMIDTNWIQNTVDGFLQTLSMSAEGFSGEATEIVNTFLGAVATAFGLAVGAFGLGLFLADFVTGFLLRRKIAKRTWKQVVLNFIVKPLFSALTAIALLWVATVIKGYTVLLLVAAVIVYEILSFMLSWLVYRDKKVKLKDVLTMKNIGLNLLTAIIVIAFNIALFYLLYLIFNVFLAVLIIVPFLIYSIKILDCNVESYICSLIGDKK